jgi:alpha-methylacyl-CoA racemase
MGPLDGVRVLEIASMAPAPFGCMVLADLGGDVVCVDRAAAGERRGAPAGPPLGRGRRSVAVDLKHPDGAAAVLRLAAAADVFVEGFRPGVTERLGIGPAECLARNPRLIYARMTGWGQDGPLAQRAGHDINYVALAGALEPIGPADRPPVPPLNLVGDFGGGGMLLALGVVAALYERERSGVGQVVDVAMVDGAALLTSFLHGMRAAGLWSDRRGENFLDGSAPYYATYTAADGRYVSVGAIEPQFYAALLDGLGLAGADLPGQHDRDGWPVLRERFAAAFAGRTRDEWAAHFAGTDACVAPVLAPAEAAGHPHNAARATFITADGLVQPAPAPRFSRTPAAAGRAASAADDPDEPWLAWGVAAGDLAGYRASGAVG